MTTPRTFMQLRRIAALAAMIVFAWPWMVRAQQISPVLVELTAARRVVSVTVVNRSDQPMTLQSQVLTWDQQDGIDRYGETSELMVVPPMATVPPGGSQIFRVALRRAPPAQELAYRLILQDVTAETRPQAAQDGGVSVHLQFRHSLPVFVLPQAKLSGQLRLQPCASGASDRPCFRIENAGGLHVKVTHLVAEGNGWRKELTPATVLPGAWRQWTLEGAAASPAIAVTAQTTAGTLTLQLPTRAQ